MSQRFPEPYCNGNILQCNVTLCNARTAPCDTPHLTVLCVHVKCLFEGLLIHNRGLIGNRIFDQFDYRL